MATWNYLAAEIRFLILKTLVRDGCNLANAAAVSREWQNIIEPHVFSRIKLTPSRLQDFNRMSYRNQHLVGYIYFCIELEEYDCSKCWREHRELSAMSSKDSSLIATACQDLLSALSIWEPKSDLVLDISVYSPSDSEHWFKYLTFEADTSIDNYSQYLEARKTVLHKADDKLHGWNAASQGSNPGWEAIEQVFDEIMAEEPFHTEEEEFEWWKQLSLAPAVTGLLLRQQTRRRWKPTALGHLFTRFPRLKEIHFEPWREWDPATQRYTDGHYQSLFESLASRELKRLVLFENFNQQYEAIFSGAFATIFPDSEAIRTSAPAVSRAVAIASLELESLSASFIADATPFFLADRRARQWRSLTSLTLTSVLFLPDTDSAEVSDMLKSAAAATIKMPKLETMELWNGRKGLAALFQYHRGVGITWRGTWNLSLEPGVMKAWEAVALKHHSLFAITKDILGPGTTIESHGDAIKYLKLINPVLRPISLQQIQMEHEMRAG